MRSKYVSLMILTLILFSASLALAAAAGPRTPANRPVPDLPIVAPTEEIAQSLFVRVPGTEEPGSRALELQVQLDGRPFLTEKLEVEAVREDVDVELLARDAATLARLFRLAEQGSRLAVSVRLAGSPLHELSFDEMAKASARLVQRRDFHPRPVESRLELAVPEPSKPDFLSPSMNKGMQPDPACEQVCNDDFIFCYYELCDQRGSCAYCNDNYNNCVASCPQVCVDPKRVYDFTSTQLVGITVYNTTCYELPNQTDYQWGERFEYRQYQWKNTRIRRTEYCNGTYSDQVLSVSYSSTYCYYRTYQVCSWPTTRLNSWQICL